ncbi:MAG: hypothetical protein ACLFTZ_05840 [Acholeplasmataceae bacterium]
MKTNDLLAQAQSLLADQPTDLSRLANASAFLYSSPEFYSCSAKSYPIH